MLGTSPSLKCSDFRSRLWMHVFPDRKDSPASSRRPVNHSGTERSPNGDCVGLAIFQLIVRWLLEFRGTVSAAFERLELALQHPVARRDNLNVALLTHDGRTQLLQ